MASSARGTASRAGERPGPGDGAGAADVPPRQERVLSEITHELGNYFHKLYYWAELLREQRPTDADAEPTRLLEGTIRELEAFLKTAVEFFRPIAIAAMSMPTTELTASIRTLVARLLDPVPVRWQIEPGSEASVVAVDPGRFSFILERICRRLQVTGGTAVVAEVIVEGAADVGAYVLTLAASGERGGGAAVAGTIEWAMIERIVELHGGAVELAATGAERRVRLTLPIRT